MSVSRTFYSCRFAPNGENPAHAIRSSQRVVHRGETVHEVFAPDAFAGTRASDVPIVLDHDMTKRAGTVTVMVPHGDWHIADFVLDGPYAARAAEYIERSGKVSPGFYDLDKDPIMATPISPGHSPTHWYTRARLDEISVLPPGAIAWYRGAKVTSIKEPPAMSKAEVDALIERAKNMPPLTERPAAAEVIYGDGTLVRRYTITPCSRSGACRCGGPHATRGARVTTT